MGASRMELEGWWAWLGLRNNGLVWVYQYGVLARGGNEMYRVEFLLD